MKTSFFSLSVLIAGAAALLSGCDVDFKVGNTSSITGSGNIVDETREVEEFHSIRFSGAGNLIIAQGDKPSLVVSVDDNLTEVIQTEVKNGVLVIRPIQSVSNCNLSVELVTTDLRSLSVSGVGNVEMTDLSLQDLTVEVSGAGNLRGNGVVENLDVELSGAGKVDLKELKAKSAKVSVSGAANCSVYASESFSGSVSGVGKATCYGNPAKFEKSVSGVGSVSKG